MPSTQVCEIVVVGAAADRPTFRVIKFAWSGAAVAVGESTGAVSHPKPGSQILWYSISFSIEGQHDPGHGIGDQSAQGFGEGRDLSGCVSVNRAVAFYSCWLSPSQIPYETDPESAS
jgi:hypothetical protein